MVDQHAKQGLAFHRFPYSRSNGSDSTQPPVTSYQWSVFKDPSSAAAISNRDVQVKNRLCTSAKRISDFGFRIRHRIDLASCQVTHKVIVVRASSPHRTLFSSNVQAGSPHHNFCLDCRAMNGGPASRDPKTNNSKLIKCDGRCDENSEFRIPNSVAVYRMDIRLSFSVRIS